MMLTMVAAAVVSTVSMSAVAVKRAQEAATPTPAAQLNALINAPTPTPRSASSQLLHCLCQVVLRSPACLFDHICKAGMIRLPHKVAGNGDAHEEVLKA